MLEHIRSEFPFLEQGFIYFDSAATTQKPREVIDRLAQAYAYDTVNIHRGIYQQSERVTTLYEDARKHIARWINADTAEIVITPGTTHAINGIARSFEPLLQPGDEIVVSALEHHANLLPWQQLASRVGAVIKIIPPTADRHLDIAVFEQLLSVKTKLVAVTAASNVLGTIVDVKRIAQLAHAVGAAVLIDAAQVIAHRAVDVRDWDVDFLAFSGHKMFGPTGVGVLFIAQRWHDRLEPWVYGGGMVQAFDWQRPVWAAAPRKFEAGSSPVAEVLGLGQAVTFITRLGYSAIKIHEVSLVNRMLDGLGDIKDIRILGPLDQLRQDGHLVSFVHERMHAHDIAAYLDAQATPIAVRAGQHCASLTHKGCGVQASVRVSFSVYNTLEEVDSLVSALAQLRV